MSEPLSTESRIFIEVTRRRVRELERAGALALSEGRDDRWVLALRDVAGIVGDRKLTPSRRIDRVFRRFAALGNVPDSDHAMAVFEHGHRKRSGEIACVTVGFSEHPLAAVNGAISLVVGRSTFTFGRRGDMANLLDPVFAIGEHALGRIHERSREAPTPDHVIGTALIVGMAIHAFTRVPAVVGHIDKGFTVRVFDLYLPGVLRYGWSECENAARRPLQSLFFDVRTALASDMISPAQRRQADGFDRFCVAIGNGGDPIAEAAKIPVVEPKDDFVSLQLADKGREFGAVA